MEAVNRREFKDKFAYVALMDEVAKENDFNLNIPRYVDTFEEEEEINLETVCMQISKTNEGIESVDENISNFCNELGISGVR